MSKSLEDINNTVSFDDQGSYLSRLSKFIGPGLLVAVGYMDPGNWITSIGGGASYGYILLFVIFISSISAMFLQSMCARLGIASGMDLAQVTRHMISKKMAVIAWIIAELAIMATDIAEVIGSTIALNLLFHIPLIVGAVITIADVFLLLLIMKFGFRKIEAIVGVLIFTILIIFLFEVYMAQPGVSDILKGFIPQKEIVTHNGILYMSLGIIGATIMPHNLYLHSSIVQSRKYDRQSNTAKKSAIQFAQIDSNIQLSIAFVVNCLLLILGAALFYGTSQDLGRFYELYDALKTSHVANAIGGGVTSTLFAVALLAAGQNSTITGTLSGQIVMEGFIHLKMQPWVRRVVTRLLAILPVFFCLLIYGANAQKIEDLLVFTQVFLSLALPLSMIPLILATNNKTIMGDAFINTRWVNIVGWLLTLILCILNIYLIISTLMEMM
ncbi:divalent metal cation transporter [Staphylococcus chromogenes]|uniref:Divalent metal cation transporter MntH n=1 Tax=Staphylococcus chromogenes TaxID=46126 RepID=A0AAX0ZGV1_STACR|nr:Nramp family divalent metal transporter [Staphylococcus chromogenes]MBV5138663.1 Nramp family divalent metal transporter [Staphylococcus chromogenes]MBW6089723.1 Nramp family divalent metal transporter [Staphylococcus chromogenes]MCD9059983.1 Nramp family divalent metal transporter [Staphylococcus chromogenes]MCD9062234.1 Nramp family divalent metal transporter [Staphylococcus chromogenes]MCD9071578.1 Nramp family divalent metal transporter [Staphylococcus chromogenes]